MNYLQSEHEDLIYKWKFNYCSLQNIDRNCLEQCSNLLLFFPCVDYKIQISLAYILRPILTLWTTDTCGICSSHDTYTFYTSFQSHQSRAPAIYEDENLPVMCVARSLLCAVIFMGGKLGRDEEFLVYNCEVVRRQKVNDRGLGLESKTERLLWEKRLGIFLRHECIRIPSNSEYGLV